MRSRPRVLLAACSLMLAGFVAGCAGAPASMGMHLAALSMPEAPVHAPTSHLTTFSAGLAPPGFAPACRRYAWLCASPSGAGDSFADAELLSMASEVNAKVNAAVVPMEDRANYGILDEWRVPENGRGDCEDYALFKMKLLLERGVDPRRLLTALVLDRTGSSHAVLVLRLESGDVVLDNLVSTVKPWERTGYTFLKKQSSHDRARWQVVLLGPRASRQIATEISGL